MNYASLQDYIGFVGEQEALEQSNLDDPSLSLINESIILEWLAAASAEIDGHLAKKYTLPIPSPPPAMLSEIACVIARKNLDRYMRREHVQQDYKDVIDRLKRIAKGDEVLTGADGIAPVQSDGSQLSGTVSFGGGNPIFTRETLRGYGRGWGE